MNGFDALWNALAQQISAHSAAIEEFLTGAAAAVVVSGIYSIPEKFPGLDVQTWWTWMRDTFQGAVPMKFQKSNHVTPVEPGKEQPNA